MTTPRLKSLLPLMTVSLACLGCDSSDERLARFAAESNRQQVEQNHRLAELQNEVAAGTRRMIEADAAHRAEMLALQQSLQEERAGIARQRDRLEEERRSLAAERRRESLLAAVVHDGALVVACLLPLLVSVVLLTRQSDQRSAEDLCDVLVGELVSDRPRLLAPTPLRALPSSSSDPPPNHQKPGHDGAGTD